MRMFWRILICGLVVVLVGIFSYWLGARDKYAQVVPQISRGYFTGFNLDKTAIVIQLPPSQVGTGFAWNNAELWIDARGVSHTGGTPTCLDVKGRVEKVTIGVINIAPEGHFFGAREIYWLRCGW